MTLTVAEIFKLALQLRLRCYENLLSYSGPNEATKRQKEEEYGDQKGGETRGGERDLVT